MVQHVSDTLPPAAGELTTCDQDCAAAAVFDYRWEWGATGRCCAVHGQLLQQTSQSLNRTIALHPIQQVGPAPLLRDERTKLIAHGLVLEAELEEAKTHGLEQYRRNGDLQVQLNSAIVKQRELLAQVDDLREQLRQSEQLSDKLSSENGTLLVELQRLRALETFVAERDERERSGGDTPNVVDG